MPATLGQFQSVPSQLRSVSAPTVARLALGVRANEWLHGTAAELLWEQEGALRLLQGGDSSGRPHLA